MHYRQNKRNYTQLLRHPEGKGSVTVPPNAWVEGNFFSRYPDLVHSITPPPEGSVIVYSESLERAKVIPPQTVVPIVQKHKVLGPGDEAPPKPKPAPEAPGVAVVETVAGEKKKKGKKSEV